MSTANSLSTIISASRHIIDSISMGSIPDNGYRSCVLATQSYYTATTQFYASLPILGSQLFTEFYNTFFEYKDSTSQERFGGQLLSAVNKFIYPAYQLLYYACSNVAEDCTPFSDADYFKLTASQRSMQEDYSYMMDIAIIQASWVTAISSILSQLLPELYTANSKKYDIYSVSLVIGVSQNATKLSDLPKPLHPILDVELDMNIKESEPIDPELTEPVKSLKKENPVGLKHQLIMMDELGLLDSEKLGRLNNTQKAKVLALLLKRSEQDIRALLGSWKERKNPKVVEPKYLIKEHHEESVKDWLLDIGISF